MDEKFSLILDANVVIDYCHACKEDNKARIETRLPDDKVYLT
jgi:hypothetical protein